MNNDEILCQITTPRFCAAVIVQDGVVVDTAPILFWLTGKRVEELVKICNDQHWTIKGYRSKKLDRD